MIAREAWILFIVGACFGYLAGLGDGRYQNGAGWIVLFFIAIAIIAIWKGRK